MLTTGPSTKTPVPGTVVDPRIIPTEGPTRPVGASGTRPGRRGVRAREGKVVA